MFIIISNERCIIRLLRVLERICKQGIIGQRNDTIVDSLKTGWIALNFRQPNNKLVATFVKDMKESYNTAVEVSGQGAFGLTALRKVINERIGNGMTLSEYFDDTLTTNTDVKKQNRAQRIIQAESFSQDDCAKLKTQVCEERHSTYSNSQKTGCTRCG